MFCTKCGNKLNDTDKFCGVCGNPVEEIKASSINTYNINTNNHSTNNRKKLGILVLLLAILLATATSLGTCGREEKAVKTIPIDDLF